VAEPLWCAPACPAGQPTKKFIFLACIYMEIDQKKVEELVAKVKEGKNSELDLSLGQDLSIALMNLISLEEHFFFSGAKTGKPEYYDLMQEIRKMRAELMKKLVKDAEPGFEKWCISKHLLAASMRLMEVGTKYMSQDKKQDAQDMFAKAYEIYSLFWGINLGAVDVGQVKKIDDLQLNKEDHSKKGVLQKAGDMVKFLINCCKEM